MDKTIIVGICSSISIYKACEVIRGFQNKDLSVQALMTVNATRLVSPLLFSALTRKHVFVDPFNGQGAGEISHIDLAKEISLFCVAPATANMIGKFASGIADDFLSTFFLAVQCPVLIAPAMNDAMYRHSQTQRNIEKLKKDGIHFIPPGKGYLACGEEGWGRLAEPDMIVEEGIKLIQKSESLKGRKILVTAGPTREHMDPVRFLTNRSSGKMGYELALEAWRRGADVVLISGPASLIPPSGVEVIKVETAEDMSKAVQSAYEQTDIVVMAAAVSDWRFLEESPHKIKKDAFADTVKLVRTPDILKDLGKKKGSRILVGFAAETENLEDSAKEKMRKKNLDMIVANNVSGENTGFSSDDNHVRIFLSGGQVVDTGKKKKAEISRIILDHIEDLIEK